MTNRELTSIQRVCSELASYYEGWAVHKVLNFDVPRLLAEVGRLRKALEGIAAYGGPYYVTDYARRVLEDKEQ